MPGVAPMKSHGYVMRVRCPNESLPTISQEGSFTIEHKIRQRYNNYKAYVESVISEATKQ